MRPNDYRASPGERDAEDDDAEHVDAYPEGY
jgi:hypothetical protein